MPTSVSLALCFLAVLHAFLLTPACAIEQDEGANSDARTLIVKRQAGSSDDFSGFDEEDASFSSHSTTTSAPAINATAITRVLQATSESAPLEKLPSSTLNNKTKSSEPGIKSPETGRQDTFSDFDEPPSDELVVTSPLHLEPVTDSSTEHIVSATTQAETTERPKTSQKASVPSSSTPNITPFQSTTPESTPSQTTAEITSATTSMDSLPPSETDSKDPFDDFDDKPVPTPSLTVSMVTTSSARAPRPPSSGSGGGRSAGGGRAAGAGLPTSRPSSQSASTKTPTTASPVRSSSISSALDRPSVIASSDDYGGILDASSRFEKISLDEALVRGRAAAAATGLGTEPEMFTWLMVLLLLLFSTVAWIWFCCVK